MQVLAAPNRVTAGSRRGRRDHGLERKPQKICWFCAIPVTCCHPTTRQGVLSGKHRNSIGLRRWCDLNSKHRISIDSAPSLTPRLNWGVVASAQLRSDQLLPRRQSHHRDGSREAVVAATGVTVNENENRSKAQDLTECGLAVFQGRYFLGRYLTLVAYRIVVAKTVCCR
jgi:hypothetical protein